MPEVKPDIEEKITIFYKDGYTHYRRFNFRQALRCFYQAWILVPKPQARYELAGRVLLAIGDCYFKMRQYDCSREALRSALHCPKAVNNAFLHLRLGQCFYELHQRHHAYREFHIAIALGGKKIFAQETDKYINFYCKQTAYSSPSQLQPESH